MTGATKAAEQQQRQWIAAARRQCLEWVALRERMAAVKPQTDEERRAQFEALWLLLHLAETETE